MKKILAILLSTVMVVSMLAVIAPASAATTNLVLNDTGITTTNVKSDFSETWPISSMVDGKAPDQDIWFGVNEDWKAPYTAMRADSANSAETSYITSSTFAASTITGGSLVIYRDDPAAIGIPVAPTLEALVDGEWVAIGTYDTSAVPEWVDGGTVQQNYTCNYVATVEAPVATQVRLSYVGYGALAFIEWTVDGEAVSEDNSSEDNSSDDTSSDVATGNDLANDYWVVSGDGQAIDNTNRITDLTDDVISEDTSNLDNWFCFLGAPSSYFPDDTLNTDVYGDGAAAIIVLDLGASTTVDTVKVHHIGNLGNGVGNPWGIMYSVCDDFDSSDKTSGTWSEAVEVTVEDVSGGVHWNDATGLNLTGRYLKVTIGFTVPWVAIDEIEVYAVASEDNSSEDNSSEDNSSEDNSSEDNSSEDNSSEDNSSEDNSSDDNSSEIPAEPTLEEVVAEAMGEANAEADFDFVIDAPETFVPGEAFDVTITVDAASGVSLHQVEGLLNYDADVLTLNGGSETAAAISAFQVIGEWEDFTKKYSGEDDVIVPGIIVVQAGTAGNDDGTITTVTSDSADQIVFKFSFTAVEGATEAALYIPHNTVKGKNVNDMTQYVGNGDSVIMTAAVEEDEPSTPSVDDSTSTPDNSKPATGDASNMIVFAILALVAVAGSAVVIKSRK